jgi:arylsulfatase
LKAQGYGTGFVYANGWLDLATGLDRGFDFFRHPQTVTEVESISSELRLRWLPGWFRSQGTRAEQINHDLLQFLDSCKPGPCFAVANYMDAHAPYIPSHEHLGRFGDGRREPADRPQYRDTAPQLEHLSGLYDESIRTLDDALGALFVALEERQVLHDAWVVVTADHGEAFGEHGEVEHSSALYGEVTQVPLIIKPPVGVTLPAPQGAVSLLDVAQTILGIAGAAEFPRGRDLRHVVSQPHAVLIEMFANANKLERDLGSRAGHPGRAIVRGAMKLVDHDGEVELFDLGTDPEETIDLAGPMPRVVEELEAHLRGALEELPPPTDRPGIPLTREEENRLRALGYIR